MTSEAIEMLVKLRDFCTQYFKSQLSAQQKKELCHEFNQLVPHFCSKVCEAMIGFKVLDREPTVIPVEGLCYVFGDIHGNLEDVYDYEMMYWNSDSPKRNGKFMFLGDFVDRGAFSTEVSLYLLSLKLLEPNRFILIRGNHEVRVVNKGYTFYNECLSKYGVKGEVVWDVINKCFESLPIAAVINNEVFCCHGGVPRSATTIEQMQQIVKPMIDPAVESPSAQELLWNDPIESYPAFNNMTDRVLKQKMIEFIPNKVRSTGYYFTSLAVQRFLDANRFCFVIRAHECVEDGFRYTSDNKVLTIFSSSHYCGKNNTTACVKVTLQQIEIETLKIGGQ